MTSDANEPQDAARPPLDPAASETERRLKSLAPASLIFDREKFYFEAGRRAALAEIAQASPPAPSAGGLWRRRFLGAASHAAAAIAAGVLVWLSAGGSGRYVPENLREAGPAVAGVSLPKDQGKGLAAAPRGAGGSSPLPPLVQERPHAWEPLTPAAVYSAVAAPTLAGWLDRLESERAAEPAGAPMQVESVPPGRFRNDARTLQALLDARDA